jgi:hypothetical protein
MKVLFLDIDGVINTTGGEMGHRICLKRNSDKSGPAEWAEWFDPACLYYLHQIVKDTGCKIVISSTWRLGETVESMKEWFIDDVIREAIIDKTPAFYSSNRPECEDRTGRIQRGEEIRWWVENHPGHPPVERYAILDDDGDMDVVWDHFFKTCTSDGLKKDVAHKVIMHLNHDWMIDHYRMNIALNDVLAEMYTCWGNCASFGNARADIIKLFHKLNEEYYSDETRYRPKKG